VFISRLLDIQYNNYDIFALKMFTIPPPCQSPELGHSHGVPTFGFAALTPIRIALNFPA
jgi:hypothetical protein